MEIKANHKTTFQELTQPGDYYITTETNGNKHLTFLCPCGCGDYAGIRLTGPHAWNWDGNTESPTTTPSIRRLDGCQWHGYLTNGTFKSC